MSVALFMLVFFSYHNVDFMLNIDDQVPVGKNISIMFPKNTEFTVAYFIFE